MTLAPEVGDIAVAAILFAFAAFGLLLVFRRKPRGAHDSAAKDADDEQQDEAPEQFAVVDLETTGLDSTLDSIIEIGALIADLDGKIYAEYESLVAVDRALSPKIIAITGLTDEDLKRSGRPLKEAFAGLMSFVGDRTIVAFNADFDMGFLRKAAFLCDTIFDNKSVCALAIARRAFPVFRSHKLDHLSDLLDIDEPAHRALSDCRRALRVFVAAAGRVTQDQPLAELRSSELVVSSLDITGICCCREPTELKLWTKPHIRQINAYLPRSIRGDGLVCVFAKDQNPALTSALEAGKAVTVTAHKTGPGAFSISAHIPE